MTEDELKEKWGQSITSLEKFQEVASQTRHDLPNGIRRVGNILALVPRHDGNHVARLDYEEPLLWPLTRDFIREKIGVYHEPTSVLKWLRDSGVCPGLGQSFPHISREDKTQIAFTPDAHQAQQDRKQRMSVGRYLRKVLLFVPDREIQRLEQQHLSELDDTFLLADTVQAIEMVYTSMAGDTGCMRYERSHFSLEEYHPSAAYCSPGMGVAYTVDGNGKVKSRSVVWVNPDDPADKRYVRIYGEPILAKKLQSQGYRMAGLAGAKLRIYEDPNLGENEIVMPWIDPAGGIHATTVDRSFDSDTAVRYLGEDFITLVDTATKNKLQRAGIAMVNVQSQSGRVEIQPVDASQFNFTCNFSGHQVSRLDETCVLWANELGIIGWASSRMITSTTGLNVNIAIAYYEGRTKEVRYNRDHRDLLCIPGYQTYFNDEATRNHVGVTLLDPLFYPDDKVYHMKNECAEIESPTGEKSYILSGDAVFVNEADECSDRHVHVSMVKPLRAEGYVPVAVINGQRSLAHKDHPGLVVTRSGKRVLKDVHAVTRLSDGTWEFTRNTTTVSVVGLNFKTWKGADNANFEVSESLMEEGMRHVFGLKYRRDEEVRTVRMMRYVTTGFMGGSAWFSRDDETVVESNYYNKPTTLEQVESAATIILKRHHSADWMAQNFGYQTEGALVWAKAVVMMMRLMREHDKAHEIGLAEANAVEAAPSMERVAEAINTMPTTDMERLLAEVDETLVTSVVRNWPRLAEAARPTSTAVEMEVLREQTLQQMATLPTDLDEQLMEQLRRAVHGTP